MSIEVFGSLFAIVKQQQEDRWTVLAIRKTKGEANDAGIEKIYEMAGGDMEKVKALHKSMEVRHLGTLAKEKYELYL